jgi:hypothetical protein
MRRLFVAGLVYLTGIAVILLIKPQYMFREDGRWKEFGIGRDPKYFTHLPLWLFAIIWAILSYLLVVILEETFYGEPDIVVAPQKYSRSRKINSEPVIPGPRELIPGYYMLNEGATGRNGIPRYVYLGPDEP